MVTSSTELTDWDAVELDYRSGMPFPMMAEKHNITVSVIKNAAQSRCWTRLMLSAEDEADIMEFAAQDKARFPIDSIFTPEQIKARALMTAGQVVRLHRTDISRLREAAKEMSDRLIGYLDATRIAGASADIISIDEDGKPALNKSDAITKMLLIIGKDSPADLLEKLSRTTVRIIEMERQAFGLESMTIPNDDGAESAITKEIRELADKIRLITVDKAQKVEPKKE